MIKDVAYYQQQFKKLRVDRSRGTAPHQPIMLLSVMEQIEQKHIMVNRIYPNASLIATFSKYWSYLAGENHRNSMHLPFFYLKSSKFWHLKVKAGLETAIKGFKPKSVNTLTALIDYAYLDPELFALLQRTGDRHILIMTLLDEWFPNKQEQIQKLFQKDAFKEFQDRLRESGGRVYTVDDDEVRDENVVIVRDAAFRRNVIANYNYQCCLCGMRVIDQKGQTIVDGAHIKPFSEFRDDRFDNGLSLCKNHHWAFDRGWFGIDEDYRIIINKNLDEITPNNRAIKDFEGKKIALPNYSFYNPRLDAIEWHYLNTFIV
ncbi:HNH endonuclease [Synechococcus moorigangaii CMS01]|nr:HNH endonuclease [Synechococcus moorigangaii CMS01]